MLGVHSISPEEESIDMPLGALLRDNVEAEDILEILGDGAVKTRPFFMNILNPDGDVKYNGITTYFFFIISGYLVVSIIKAIQYPRDSSFE